MIRRFVCEMLHNWTYVLCILSRIKINDQWLESSPNQVGRTATGVRERIVCVHRSIGQDEIVTRVDVVEVAASGRKKADTDTDRSVKHATNVNDKIMVETMPRELANWRVQIRIFPTFLAVDRRVIIIDRHNTIAKRSRKRGNDGG